MHAISEIPHPPRLPGPHLEDLHAAIIDYQFTHGSLVKRFKIQTPTDATATPISASMFPTLYPRAQFQKAVDLQTLYNELYARVAENPMWLEQTIGDLLKEERGDEFSKVLWGIWKAVLARGGPGQSISAGIFRSDYMLHCEERDVKAKEDETGSGPLHIKQVEFNTFSCAGGTHNTIVTEMHHHLLRTGAYTPCMQSAKAPPLLASPLPLPRNNTLGGIVAILEKSYRLYGPARSSLATRTAILIPVQPHNVNVADERPIEYELWGLDPEIPTYRMVFPSDLDERLELGSNKELLFYHPNSATPVEISVVYWRAGYEVEEYRSNYQELGSSMEGNSRGVAVRTITELSRAIKCPSLLGHLCTFKRVQQALCAPGIVEKFLEHPSGNEASEASNRSNVPTAGESQVSRSEAVKIRDTFMDMFSLADAYSRRLAMRPESAKDFVLKPASAEGGGHNTYGTAIPSFVRTIREADFANYVLMQRITPPRLENILLSPRGIHEGSVISELGVIGGCIWEAKRTAEGDRPEVVMLHNEQIGWVFKTKPEHVNEMSVIKGWGGFDTPCLVDV